jgi:hypothetical protein
MFVGLILNNLLKNLTKTNMRFSKYLKAKSKHKTDLKIALNKMLRGNGGKSTMNLSKFSLMR